MPMVAHHFRSASRPRLWRPGPSSRRSLDQHLFARSLGHGDGADLSQFSEEVVADALQTSSCYWPALIDSPELAAHPRLQQRARARFAYIQRTLELGRRALRDLDQEGIPYLPLKGASWLREGRPVTERVFGDLDIVIAHARIGEVLEVLKRRGPVTPRGSGNGRHRKYALVVGDVRLRLEFHLDSYGIFPWYDPYTLATYDQVATRQLEASLIAEEWLENGHVRARDIRDLQWLVRVRHGGSVESMLASFPSTMFRAIAVEALSRYGAGSELTSARGLRLHRMVARRFVRQRGRWPLCFGAHWVRAIVLIERKAPDAPVSHSARSVGDMLYRYYRKKLSLWQRSLRSKSAAQPSSLETRS